MILTSQAVASHPSVSFTKIFSLILILLLLGENYCIDPEIEAQRNDVRLLSSHAGKC